MFSCYNFPIYSCSTLATFVMAASRNMNRDSHLPISMTYDLLPKGSVLSFLWLQFPRMAFLVLVLWAGKQGKGRGKRPRKEAEEQGRPYPGKRVLNPQLEVDIPAYLIIKFKNFCVKLTQVRSKCGGCVLCGEVQRTPEQAQRLS